MNKIVSLLILIFFISCNQKENIPLKISLNNNWKFKGKDTLDWQRATVPGNIFTDLISNKIIENPFIKTNEEKVQWVSERDWIYSCSFELSEEILSKNNIELTFEGLDTYAKIFINGNHLLNTENAFRKYSISLKEIPLFYKNELKIIFKNHIEIENNFAKKSKYKLPEGNRVYTRKAQFQYGWDWGPKLNSSGIWKNIFLTAWDEVRINDIYIKQNNITDKKAYLTAEIQFESDKKINSEIEILVENKIIKKQIKLQKGLSIHKIDFYIENPKLWWTHNLGNPYLYKFDFTLKSNGKVKDKKSLRKGIRTIKLINKKDSIGESFYFELNEKPVFIKGANYIPQNSFQNNVTKKHYNNLLSDVVESNMNMLRVWGGGIYENDIFYSLCDEKGILIWQDFMFACAMYPGNKEFLANIEIEAKEQVTRLRKNTCIALWCGNNENSEGWHRWGWQQDRSKEEKKFIWNNYLKVFDTILPNIVNNYSDINYWESSPKYGRGNIKYKTDGDAHDWWIWHDAYPFEHLENNVPRFMSEFGFQSFPSYETIKYINQKEEIDIKTKAIKNHQKHNRGFKLIDEYMIREYTKPLEDEDYVYVSQLLQAKGIVMGIEAQRRAKPYNMGTLYWQLNDCWPSISWSGIDYFGNWKALQYKVKKAYKNILISSKIENDSIKTYLVNDSLKNINGNINFKIIDFNGNETWIKQKKISLKENSSNKINSLELSSLNLSECVFITEFKNHRSLFYFVKPKDLKLKKGEIEKVITKENNGFSITLKSKTLQKDVFIYANEKGKFSDNFFDLLPNEEKKISFKTKSMNVKKFHIKTLNKINLKY